MFSRRGSAIALSASEVVAARAMAQSYAYIGMCVNPVAHPVRAAGRNGATSTQTGLSPTSCPATTSKDIGIFGRPLSAGRSPACGKCQRRLAR